MTVAPDRLHPLVLGKAKPRDRSEQEVQDYRRALNEIHSAYAALSIAPDTLLRLHSLCQSAAGDAGQYKRVDNDIVEFLPGQAPVVRFRCVKAAETPAAVLGTGVLAAVEDTESRGADPASRNLVEEML